MTTTRRRVGALAGMVGLFVVTVGAGGADALQADSSGVVGDRVRTHGVSVSVSVVPRCGLAGDDPDSSKRADAFLIDLRTAVGRALGEVEFPLGFSEWVADVDLESLAQPPSSNAIGVRVVKPSSGLDRELMQAMYRGRMPKLPNFRARCTITVSIRPWQPPGSN